MTGWGGLPRLHVLLVADDARHAAEMRQALLRAEPALRITTAARLATALEALADPATGPAIGCVVTDLRLPDAEGMHVVRALRSARRELPLIVATAAGSEDLAVAAMKMGAADYVSRRVRPAELPEVVREALGRSVLAGIAELPAEPGALPATGAEPMLATTAAMRDVFALVERAARSAAPVLIEGETGTGKELLARAVHERGPRRHAPFLAQNCAAMAEGLLESELFGHCRGAFTGADRDRRGLFEEAADGTVFLDEIGEAPPAVQAKLLRVLQHEEVKAVGADRPRRVRARIVAATHRQLEGEVRAGRFRHDLYWRLAVFPIHVPPLRHRIADVPALVAAFLRRFEAREARTTGGVDPDALRALQAYSWPGNVRELENEMHRLVLTVPAGRRIGRQHLAARIRDAEPLPDAPLARLLACVEVALIRQRLRQSTTKTAAARSLGITREALYAKMRRLGIRREA